MSSRFVGPADRNEGMSSFPSPDIPIIVHITIALCYLYYMITLLRPGFAYECADEICPLRHAMVGTTDRTCCIHGCHRPKADTRPATTSCEHGDRGTCDVEQPLMRRADHHRARNGGTETPGEGSKQNGARIIGSSSADASRLTLHRGEAYTPLSRVRRCAAALSVGRQSRSGFLCKPGIREAQPTLHRRACPTRTRMLVPGICPPCHVRVSPVSGDICRQGRRIPADPKT